MSAAVFFIYRFFVFFFKRKDRERERESENLLFVSVLCCCRCLLLVGFVCVMMAYQAIPGPGSGSSSSSGFQSSFGDTTYTKVFVGGLAWETQSETMRRYFEQFGDILEAVVIADKNTGRSKGYGFVTFKEAEAAKRACVDPSPIIDGRRANCNLASLGRPLRPSVHYGRARSVTPYLGGAQPTRWVYFGSPGYQQSVPYSYQQGFMHPSYGHTTYGSEYVYPQGVPYVGQQYFQIYGAPGAVNPAIYHFGQIGQTVSGAHGYSPVQNYPIPGHQIVQFGAPSGSAITTSPIPTLQTPFHAGMASSVPGQPQFIVPAHSQFMPGSGSDQTVG